MCSAHDPRVALAFPPVQDEAEQDDAYMPCSHPRFPAAGSVRGSNHLGPPTRRARTGLTRLCRTLSLRTQAPAVSDRTADRIAPDRLRDFWKMLKTLISLRKIPQDMFQERPGPIIFERRIKACRQTGPARPRRYLGRSAEVAKPFKPFAATFFVKPQVVMKCQTASPALPSPPAPWSRTPPPAG
jgi:hypothetical protein